MSSLVADYGSSGEEDDEDPGTDSEEQPPHQLRDTEGHDDPDTDSDEHSDTPDDRQAEPSPSASKLPRPDFIGSSLTNSVFSNPYAAAEEAKTAILEKHVKMVPTNNRLQMINGKKICWNYRKGKCRFGHNCKFAHDSDLQKSREQLEEENQTRNTVLCENVGMQDQKISEWVRPPEEPPAVVESKKNKRPGLSQGLIPSKKAMKMYKKQQVKDSWKTS